MSHGKGPLTSRPRRPQALHYATLKLKRTDAFAAATRGTIEVTQHRDGTSRTHIGLGRFDCRA
ncbi:MAG TPA: hypothetical protein VE844_18325, partial [Gammaproteobacteria bacterium]|nr:hypothetical protein [Gammaproteobacteria bacterium]